MPYDILVKKNASVDDTLQLIINAINQCKTTPFVQKVVAELSELHDPKTDPEGFIKALFDLCCRNGKYKLDIPGIEEVWTPEKTFREGKFDCKKITTYICSVLAAAGIEPIAKHVYYKGPDGGLQDYTHIYTIVPASSLRTGMHTMEFVLDPYITVDPTNDCKYNSEVDYEKSTLYFLNGKKMELHMMGRTSTQSTPPGINTSSFASAAASLEDDMLAICNSSRRGCVPADYSLVGLTAKDGSKVLFDYTAGEAVEHAAAVVALVAARAAFLGLIYLGAFAARFGLKIHWGKRLGLAWQKNPAMVRKTWWQLGGEKTASALRTAIMKSSGMTISGPYGYGFDYPGLYRPGMNGTTIGEPVTLATAAAAVAVAAPAITAMVVMMKKLGVFKTGDKDPAPPDDAKPPTPPDPPAPGGGGAGPGPSAESFATSSIDNISDLLNFVKGSAVILLGSSFNPALIIPSNIIVLTAFIYGMRNNVKKIIA